MKKHLLKISFAFTLALFMSTSLVNGQTIIDFETENDGYTASGTEGSGTTDVFNRVQPNIGGNSSWIWAVEDMTLTTPTITLDAIDISALSLMDFSIDLLTPNTNDWDLTDEVKITYSIDGGEVKNLMWIQSVGDGDDYNSPAALDLGFDGTGDAGYELPAINDDFGADVGFNFETFSVEALPVSGSSIVITLQFFILDAGAEGIYIDNIIIDDGADTDPPVATFVEDGATDVLLHQNLTITLDEAILNIDGSAVTNLNTLVVLTKTDASGEAVPFSATIDANKQVITVDPTSDLDNDQLYYIALNPVEDALGNESALQTGSFTGIGALTPWIDVTGPAEGTKFYAGGETTITWLYANIVGGVDILAYVPDLDSWEVMVTDAACNGSNTFTIPADAQYSDLYKVKVVDNLSGLIEDSSEVVTVVSIPTINDIQSNTSDGDATVFLGHIVKSSGIVTSIAGSNYWIQDGDGAYNGMYFYDSGNASSLTVGDSITFEGEVTEYYGATEIINVTDLTINNSGNTLPTPAIITTADLIEAYESVLVKVESGTIATAPNNYGEFKYTDNPGDTIIVDDKFYAHPAVVDNIVTITGIGTYSFNNWTLWPRSEDDIIFNMAQVSSTKYTVDQDLETITGVPFTAPLADFESNITADYSGAFETYDADGITVADDLATGYKVIATAEDGTTTKTYVITIDAVSTDATLSDLQVSGTTVTDFASGTYTYAVELDAGTTATPAVIATENHEYANAVVTPAEDVNGDTEAKRTTTITVTAEDGTTTQDYTIVFSVASGTGINEIANGFKIYPNPSSGMFTVEMNNVSNGEYSVEVYDVIGKMIYKSQITESITDINLTHMNAGLYYVSVNNGNEKNITKIMIQ